MAAAKGNKYNMKGDEVMSSLLQCRITPKFKAKCVKQAMKENLKLCEWVTKTLNNAL